jgi:hypothetical protein
MAMNDRRSPTFTLPICRFTWTLVRGRGVPNRSLQANEITNLERAEVDPSIFEIAARFKAAASPMAPVTTAASPKASASADQPAPAPRDSAAFPATIGAAAKHGASEGRRRACARERLTLWRRRFVTASGSPGAGPRPDPCSPKLATIS